MGTDAVFRDHMCPFRHIHCFVKDGRFFSKIGWKRKKIERCNKR